MSKFILFSRLNKKKETTVLKCRQQRWYKILSGQRKFFNILSVALIISLGVCYLFSVNQTASKGFEVSSLEDQLADLSQDNQKLELEISELLSMSEVQEVSKNLDLVAVDKVDYLKDSVVALSE